MRVKISLIVEEKEHFNRAIGCIDHMLDAVMTRDYKAARQVIKSFESVLDKLQEIEMKKARSMGL
ncbi:hypothetical protein [Geobacillus sp. TFV-3]|uniref:hypothetical protein n=1 Tax=Geobacillus sp. TFV-3 TaxID=1897059 RepID=UPI00135ACA46|nr:hypothetical protein [Geobacillus sp. TFV-3]KAF0994390.1 hypothetical protein BJQ97_01032 [Geobacillus sp. TFV-3]